MSISISKTSFQKGQMPYLIIVRSQIYLYIILFCYCYGQILTMHLVEQTQHLFISFQISAVLFIFFLKIIIRHAQGVILTFLQLI